MALKKATVSKTQNALREKVDKSASIKIGNCTTKAIVS